MKPHKLILLAGALFVLIVLANVARTCLSFVFNTDERGDEEQLVNAVQIGDREWAERILAKDPKFIETKDRYGRTLLFLAVAATKNETEMAARLLELGADVDAAEQNGFTPLYWAAFDGNAELVDLLLANGANANAKTQDGKT